MYKYNRTFNDNYLLFVFKFCDKYKYVLVIVYIRLCKIILWDTSEFNEMSQCLQGNINLIM